MKAPLGVSFMSVRQRLRQEFRLSIAHWATYIITYFLAGTVMNQAGQWMEIARFTYWWQVITVYVLYMVPISILMRRLPWWQQYAYGLFPMGLLEFGGYALHSSYAYPNNVLDRIFSQRNFSLGMVLFFAAYFPLLNVLVARVYRLLATQESLGSAGAEELPVGLQRGRAAARSTD
jgi:hypothetical protein